MSADRHRATGSASRSIISADTRVPPEALPVPTTLASSSTPCDIDVHPSLPAAVTPSLDEG